jgi:hypothetical protein
MNNNSKSMLILALMDIVTLRQDDLRQTARSVVTLLSKGNDPADKIAVRRTKDLIEKAQILQRTCQFIREELESI